MPSLAAWDARYRVAERSIPAPDGFLAEAKPHLAWPSGGMPSAVDVACGGGRHALELARWGLDTLAVDYSREALQLCRQRAATAGLHCSTLRLDLEAPGADLGRHRFDLLAVFNYLHRPLIPTLKRSLRPGGIVVYKTYTRKQLQFCRGPRNPAFLLEEHELRELFGDFSVLVYREECTHDATAGLVARRPVRD